MVIPPNQWFAAVCAERTGKEAVAKRTDLMDDARKTAMGLEVAQREAHVSLTQTLAPSAPLDSC
jgi:hypothetical protein